MIYAMTLDGTQIHAEAVNPTAVSLTVEDERTARDHTLELSEARDLVHSLQHAIATVERSISERSNRGG